MTAEAPVITSAEAQKAVRNASALIAASILSKGIVFIWQIVLGSALGPFEYGIYNTVFALLAVAAPLASFSMGLIVIRDVAREPQKLGQYWSALLFMQTGLSLFAYVGAVVAAITVGYSQTIVAFTALAGMSIFIDLLGNQSHDLLLAQERMTVTSLVEIMNIGLRVGLAAWALSMGWGLTGVYLATIASGVVRSVVLWRANWQAGFRPTMPLNRPLARLILLNSLPLALAATLSMTYQHIDKLMTTRIIGEENTGYLGPAFLISTGVIELLNTTVLVALYPLMSRYSADSRGETFGFMIEKLTRFMVIITLPIALSLSIFAVPLVELIFAPEYAPTAGILQIFIWYTFLTMAGNVIAQGLMIQNRQRYLLMIRAGGLALNIVLNTILLLRYRDPRGAALASVIAEALTIALMLWQFRAPGWETRRFLMGLPRLLLIGAITAGVMAVVGQVHFILGGIVGAAVYLAGMMLGGGLTPDDRALLQRVLRTLPGSHRFLG